MQSGVCDKTRLTLLARVAGPGSPNQQAWHEFVNRYGPLIMRTCALRGLQPNDAQEVTQNVLIRLFTSLNTYKPEKGRFRDWLQAVAANAVISFHRERQRQRAKVAQTDQVEALLESVEAREDLLQRLGQEFDLELLEEAKEQVKHEVGVKAFECFRLLTEEGLTGEEVAERLGMSRIGTVYTNRLKVQEKIQATVLRLESEGQA